MKKMNLRVIKMRRLSKLLGYDIYREYEAKYHPEVIPTRDLGHIAYQWLHGSVPDCTCGACTKAWSLDKEYINLELFLQFLDNKENWEIRWRK